MSIRYSICKLLFAGAIACSAPESRPAGGEIGEQVKASLTGGVAKFDHAGWNRDANDTSGHQYHCGDSEGVSPCLYVIPRTYFKQSKR